MTDNKAAREASAADKAFEKCKETRKWGAPRDWFCEGYTAHRDAALAAVPDVLREIETAYHLAGPGGQITVDRQAFFWAIQACRRLAETERELAEWRVMFACAYSGVALYRDDGELQDNRTLPFIDFKRDSLEQVNEKLLQRLSAALASRGDSERAEGM